MKFDSGVNIKDLGNVKELVEDFNKTDKADMEAMLP